MRSLTAGARKLSHWTVGNAYLLLVLTTAAWGGNAVAGRFAVGEVSPMALVALRWLGVVLLVLLFARRQIVAELPVLRTHWRFLAVLGTLGFTVFNALFYTAAQTTTAINIGIIQGSIPVFVLIGAFLVDRTPVTRLQMLGVTVTMLGVVTVTAGGDLERLLQLRFAEGDLIMLVACGFYAAYTVACAAARRCPPWRCFPSWLSRPSWRPCRWPRPRRRPVTFSGPARPVGRWSPS